MLAFATNILMVLKTGFVDQGHIAIENKPGNVLGCILLNMNIMLCMYISSFLSMAFSIKKTISNLIIKQYNK